MRSLLLPRSPAALLGGLAAVLNGVARVAIVPLFVTPLFDDVLQVQDTTALPRVLLVAAVVAVGGSLALWAQDALLGRAAADLSARWRSRIYRALLGARPGRLPGTSGGLASRIINDLKEIETYIRFGLGTLVAESVTLALIFVLLVRANATAALALVALALPTVLALRWLGGYLQRASEHSMNQSEVVGRHLQEGLRHLELVRAFGAREYMHERFEPANDEVRRAMAQRSLIAGLQAPLTQVLVFVAVGVLVLFLVAGVSRGTMTVGDVIAFLTLVALATTPTQLLPHGYAHLRQAAAAAQRLGALVGREERPEAPEAQQAHASEPGGADGPVGFVTRSGAASHGPGGPPPLLRIEGVSFSYPGGRRVLEDVWLRLPPTGLVVLSGPSGSGKTTLLRLLLRFDQPTGGAIHVGNTPLADVAEEELRRLIAYVPQDHGIISGRVRDVLAMGRTVSYEQVRQALEAVGMLGAVSSLPGGLSAELGEDGGGLSGGQRQRLAIARALLGDPDALVLDEPTSNLDDTSESEIVALLARLAEERLVLAVTHRPALAAAADSLVEAVPAHAVA